MKLDVVSGPIQKLRPDLLVILLDPRWNWLRSKIPKWQSSSRSCITIMRRRKSKRNTSPSGPVKASAHVLVTHSSLDSAYNTWEKVKILSARALGHAKDLNLSSLVFLLNGKDGPTYLGKVVEGIILGSYSFERYKKEKTTYFDDMKLSLLVEESAIANLQSENAIAIGWSATSPMSAVTS